jgi:16S rRNA processing protein RimM
MQKQDCLLIGKVVKSHGIHGELIIETSNPEAFQNIKESIHLEIEGLLVPFFIQKIHHQSTERFRIKFHWLDNEKQTQEIMNCDVFIPTSDLGELEQNLIITPHLLIGYKAIDKVHGNIGEVQDYIDQPNNPILVIKEGRNEILIPYHPDLISTVENRKKTVYLDTPEGLIDLYLS